MNFEEEDKKNILEYVSTLLKSTPNIGIRVVKNTLGFFHIEKKETEDSIYLSPESWINILSNN